MEQTNIDDIIEASEAYQEYCKDYIEHYLNKSSPQYNQKNIDKLYQNILANKADNLQNLYKYYNSHELTREQMRKFKFLIINYDKLASKLGSHVSNELAPTILEPTIVEGGKRRTNKRRITNKRRNTNKRRITNKRRSKRSI